MGCEAWLLNDVTSFRKVLHERNLFVYVIPVQVISIASCRPLHRNLPGLEASPEVILVL